MTKDLKPCPFCGDTSVEYDGNLGILSCSSCGASTCGDNIGDAIDRWNQRVEVRKLSPEALASCPFCGSSAILEDDDPECAYVNCVFCLALGPAREIDQNASISHIVFRDYSTLDELVAGWNRRVGPGASIAEHSIKTKGEV